VKGRKSSAVVACVSVEVNIPLLLLKFINMTFPKAMSVQQLMAVRCPSCVFVCKNVLKLDFLKRGKLSSDDIGFLLKLR
jgi:hypothetical protein